MGQLFRRGLVYWGDFFDPLKRRRVRQSLRTRDVKVARERLRVAELGATNPAADPPPLRPLGDALDYLIKVACNDRADATRRFYTQKCLHLLRLLGADTPIEELDRPRIAAYAKTRLEEGAHRNTVGKELITLRRALKEQHEIRPLPRPPADVMPKWSSSYTPITRNHSPEQFAALLAVAPAKRRLWLVCAVYTGANLSELEKLTTSGVDLAADRIRIPGTKRKTRDRVVPIPPPLRPWLVDALAEHGAAGAPPGPLVGRWKNSVRDLEELCAKAGVPRVTSNDLRRTYASWLKQRGVDSKTVADLMGHSSTRMVDQVYGRLTPEVYQRAVASLPVIVPGQLALPAPGAELAPFAAALSNLGASLADGGALCAAFDQGLRWDPHSPTWWEPGIALDRECVAGVPDDAPLTGTATPKNGKRSRKRRARSQRFRVPSPGIEPGTRGFSVRWPRPRYRRHHYQRAA